MKLFIILALVAFTSAEWNLKTQEEWKEIRKHCLELYPKPEKPEQKLQKTIIVIRKEKEYDKYPSKEVFQRILCYLEGLEIWNDSDGFLVDRIMIGLENAKEYIGMYNENLLREGLMSCSDKNDEGSSPYDWGYRCFKCFMDNEYLIDSLMDVSFYEN